MIVNICQNYKNHLQEISLYIIENIWFLTFGKQTPGILSKSLIKVQIKVDSFVKRISNETDLSLSRNRQSSVCFLKLSHGQWFSVVLSDCPELVDTMHVCYRWHGASGLTCPIIQWTTVARQDALEGSAELGRHEAVEHRVYSTGMRGCKIKWKCPEQDSETCWCKYMFWQTSETRDPCNEADRGEKLQCCRQAFHGEVTRGWRRWSQQRSASWQPSNKDDVEMRMFSFSSVQLGKNNMKPNERGYWKFLLPAIVWMRRMMEVVMVVIIHVCHIKPSRQNTQNTFYVYFI